MDQNGGMDYRMDCVALPKIDRCLDDSYLAATSYHTCQPWYLYMQDNVTQFWLLLQDNTA